MTRTREHRMLSGLLGIGAVGTFFGHGMFAIGGKDSFVTLLTGSVNRVLGFDLSPNTGLTIVRVIGWVDVAIAAALALLVVGAIRERGTLYAAAYSRGAIVLFAWGVIWGFLTAASRVTAAEAFYPTIWDLVERAPNFMLPAGLLFVVMRHRTAEVSSPAVFARAHTEV